MLALWLALTAASPACRPEPPPEARGASALTKSANPERANAIRSEPARADDARPHPHVAPEHDFTPPGSDGYGRAAGLRYLEHVVSASPDDPLPMVVLVHGLGDRPGAHLLDLVRVERPARVIMPEAPTPYDDGFAWFPFRARGDPAVLARGIAGAATRLSAALAALERGRPTRGRPLLTGFSQGGMLSFAIGLHHPERVALALPIAGTLPEALWPSAGPAPGAPKILALHGTADELVPFEPTKRLVAALQAHGYDARLFAYDGVGHYVSEAMRARVAGTLEAALDAAR